MTTQPDAALRIELPWSKWPNTDRAAWMTVIRRGDVLDEAGAGAHWAPGTRAKYAQSYGFWLGFLDTRGRLDEAVDPADRVHPDVVIAYVRDASERCTPETVAMRVAEFLWVIRAMRPESDWQWLEKLLRRLQRQCRPSELKRAPAVSAGEVYRAGHAIMRAAEDAADLGDEERAIRFRDGLMLALLIARPLRLRTFLNIELERNLVRTSDGYLLVFAAEDIKTKRPRAYPARYGLDPIRDIQVLCPMNRGGLGARSLNIDLQQALNPPGELRVERFGSIYGIGDKVMQVENHYDKEVYNGDLGVVRAIDAEAAEMVLEFDGREVTYGFGELDEIVLAYAVTIHKSQGSEYPAVVIPLTPQHYPMLQRNLLYTAVTRGKRLVVMLARRKLWPSR